LPLAFLVLSAIVAGIFYPQLPAEIAYHFQGNVPDKTISSGALIAWMLIPQVFFILTGFAVVRVVMMGARYAPPGETPFGELLPVMGNMLVLPQIVIFFIMLQIFLYNVFQTRIIPLWILPAVILVLGGVILAVIFMRVIRRYRSRKNKTG
jgi:uncharacterized membrane protein